MSDIRDGKTYQIKKLADGNCWMTQNLRLVGSKKLTSADSNVSSDYTLPASSTSGWCNDTNATCYDKENVLDSGNTSYGVYYSWKAATAGTGTSAVASGNATASICPKGWRLPTGGSSGEFQALYDYYSSSADMRSTTGPAFVLPGYLDGGNTYYQGSRGFYWSSTAGSSNFAYALYLNSSDANPANNNYKYHGFTVRCISR